MIKFLKVFFCLCLALLFIDASLTEMNSFLDEEDKIVVILAGFGAIFTVACSTLYKLTKE